MTVLTNEDLDKIEKKYISALKSSSDSTPAAKLELMRKTLLDNGRLVVTPTPGDASEFLLEDDEDIIPFPVAQTGN